MKGTPTGQLRDGQVVVDDEVEAERLHARWTVGARAQGNLVLSLVEAAWLASEGRLAVQADGAVVSAAALLAGAPGARPVRGGAADARTEVGFLAYADLRGRGLLVRPWAGGWGVWPRGAGGRDDPEYTVAFQAERDPVSVAQLASWADARTVLALVDEDGDVTYYRAETETPQGSCPRGELPHLAGRVLADRVVVEDTQAEIYHAREHLGVATRAGLVLSFTEAEALRRRGVLELPGDLASLAAVAQPHFNLTLPVYEALRAAGVVARSGFKFGTHLRGYRADPEHGHAEWLVQCALLDEALQWADLSRAIRLAHGVRKSFLLAWGSPVRFLRLSWFKP